MSEFQIIEESPDSKFVRIKNQNESKDSSHLKVQVEEIDIDKQQSVQEYAPTKSPGAEGFNYAVFRRAINQNISDGSRFHLSDLSYKSLSVDQEFENRVQAEVDKRFAALEQEVRSVAEKKGYEEGLQKGKVDGRNELLEQSQDLIQSIGATLKGFETIRTDMFALNQEIFFTALRTMIRVLTLREATFDVEYTKRLVQSLLQQLHTASNVRVFVSGEVFETIKSLENNLKLELGTLQNFSIEIDPTIKDFGCVVKSDLGDLDARVETQLKNLMELK